MKIGIEAQRLFRKKKHGMDIVVLELIKNLQKIDNENEYFIFVRPDHDELRFAQRDNFHFIKLSGGPYPIWEQMFLPKAARRCKLDLLHCTANTVPLNIDIPVVLTLHDIIFLERLDFTKGTWYQRFGNLYRRLIVPRIINKCAVITTVSESENKKVTKYFNLPSGKIKTLYNGVGNHFKVIRDKGLLNTIKEKYSLPEKFILSLGNRDPRKNSKNVIKAYALFCQKGYEDFKLFIPDIDSSFIRAASREIKSFDQIMPNVISSDYIPNKDLPYIYNLASMFLFPSTRESFGIPILEAMSCGTPVITSNTSSMPEVAGKAALYIDPYSSLSICNGMSILIDDKSLYDHLIVEGLERVKNFSWEKTARQWLEIYESVGKCKVY